VAGRGVNGDGRPPQSSSPQNDLLQPRVADHHPGRADGVRVGEVGAALTQLKTVLPKPKSIDPAARREVERNVPCDERTRGPFQDADTALDYLESRAAGEDLILLDVGGYLLEVYTRTRTGESITRYQTTGHYFHLMNNGNAVNFLHGAGVGPFIFLVQAEILAAVRILARAERGPGMHEVDAVHRAAVAATWLDYVNR